MLQPHALTAEQIVRALPPKGHGSSISFLPFLKGRIRFLMEHLRRFTLRRDQSLRFSIPSQKPVLRVIMNLIPTNGPFQLVQGDIGFLPSATSWLPICVVQGEEVTIFQSEMTAAFYLFSIPEVWEQFMCFNFRIRGKDLGIPGLRADRWYRPACKVLPMGWSSSVSTMQAVSRQVLLLRGLPLDLESKKGSPPPIWFAQVRDTTCSPRSWWQVYLDNFGSRPSQRWRHQG